MNVAPILRARTFLAMLCSKALSTGSFHFEEALLCSNCGREIEASAKFCDGCGRKLTVEEQLWKHTTPPHLLRPSADVIEQPGPKTIPAHEGTPAAEEAIESKAVSSQSFQSTRKQTRHVFPRRPHFSRRLMILSAIGLTAVTIIAVSVVAYPILSGGTLSFWQGTTSSQTTVTSTTGGALSVQINIANDPVALGGVQTVAVTVLDPRGQPVPEAQVHLEVTYPSGQVPIQRDGQTDTGGSYSATWQIAGLPENVGAYQVRVSAAKEGYETGQAQATFLVSQGA